MFIQVKCVFNHQLLHGDEIVLGIVSSGSGICYPGWAGKPADLGGGLLGRRAGARTKAGHEDTPHIYPADIPHFL